MKASDGRGRTCVMQVMWRLRSPFSDAVTECRVLGRSRSACELRLLSVRPFDAASSWFTDRNAAVRSATVLANTLRSAGWSDA